MSITIGFHQFNPLTGEYSDTPIPFTFGSMSTEYYNYIKGHNDKINDYGYFIDNIITRGSNVFEKILGDGITALDFGITASDFEKSENTNHDLLVKFYIKEDLYATVSEQIIIQPHYNLPKGVCNIICDVQITFSSPKTSLTYNLNQGTAWGVQEKTYEDFMSIAGSGHPIKGIAKSINQVWGLNSYPYYSELVEESKTSTGCLIQEYLYQQQPDGGFYISQSGTQLDGIKGSEVNPYVSGSATFFVPLILGAGIISEFPESESKNVPGDYDPDNDQATFPGGPLQTAVISGMVNLYQMKTTQIRDFAKFLWSSDMADWDNFINTLKQWFYNPLDSIISLSICPVDFFYNYIGKESVLNEATNIKLAGFDTGVKGHLCSNNIKTISLGKLSIRPYYNSYLDCNPHTKWSLFLPYIGFKDIDSDVLYSEGYTDMEVEYMVDLITGVCVANILVEKEANGTHLKHVLYTFAGNMNTVIPISSANMRDFMSATVGAAASTMGVLASGGTITPVIAGSMLAQQGLNIASQKVNVAHSGGMSLESGSFGHQFAYLVVTRPREARPEHYKNINGIPSEISGTLEMFSGFTQVSSVVVEINGATDSEKKEIEQLLKEGVIL